MSSLSFWGELCPPILCDVLWTAHGLRLELLEKGRKDASIRLGSPKGSVLRCSMKMSSGFRGKYDLDGPEPGSRTSAVAHLIFLAFGGGFVAKAFLKVNLFTTYSFLFAPYTCSL